MGNWFNKSVDLVDYDLPDSFLTPDETFHLCCPGEWEERHYINFMKALCSSNIMKEYLSCNLNLYLEFMELEKKVFINRNDEIIYTLTYMKPGNYLIRCYSRNMEQNTLVYEFLNTAMGQYIFCYYSKKSVLESGKGDCISEKLNHGEFIKFTITYESDISDEDEVLGQENDDSDSESSSVSDDED